MARSDVPGDRRAARVVALVTARRAVRSGAIWGLVFGGSAAAIALSYAGAFPTAASRAKLASSLGGNIGLTALYGQARRIDTVAGFTAWRSGAIVWIGAIWGLLIATRLLRGEEEAGRWELFLAGRTTRRRAAVQAVAGLGAGLATLWILTATFMVMVGSTSGIAFSISASLFFATTLVAGAAVFLAIGMLVGELGATRHQANIIGAAVLVAGLLLRMIADAGVGFDWLRWLSPFGWIQELHPLTGSNVPALVPIVVVIVTCVAAAVRLAGARDLGSSALPSGDTSPPRTRLLSGQAGLTVRLTRPAIAAWLAGLAVCGLLFGLFAQAATAALRGTTAIEEVIARLGGSGAAAASFLGLEFVFIALLVAFAAAGQIAAARAEEAQGHLDHLFARPVARWRWLAGRLGVAVGLVLCASVLAGVAAWAGAASQHSGLGFGRLVEAGLNVAPAAVFVLGIGALAFGVRPRLAAGVTYGLLAWSFLVELVASLVNGNHWLLDTSFLTHIAPAPAADPNWTAGAWLVGIGLIAALAGMLAFGRRDLAAA